MTNDFSKIRREYRLKKLSISDVDKDPIIQFNSWLEEAIETKVNEPTAMSLATVLDNKPTIRTVLLKEIYNNNLCFFSNYNSIKGKQIEANPNGSILFFWPELERQIHIEGTVSKLSNIKSDEYFSSRSKGSKIAACISQQSQTIESRSYLEKLFNDFEAKYGSNEITRPPYWGGYQLSPQTFEFWQGRENRLNDRIKYIKNKDSNWQISRLAP